MTYWFRTMAQLTDTQRAEIRELHAGGRSQRALAKEYGVSRGTINRVLNGGAAAQTTSRKDSTSKNESVPQKELSVEKAAAAASKRVTAGRVAGDATQDTELALDVGDYLLLHWRDRARAYGLDLQELIKRAVVFWVEHHEEVERVEHEIVEIQECIENAEAEIRKCDEWVARFSSASARIQPLVEDIAMARMAGVEIEPEIVEMFLLAAAGFKIPPRETPAGEGGQ